MQVFEIEYQYGTYSGTETVTYSDEECEGDINPVAKMWARFSRQGLLTLPMAYKSAKVVRQYAHE